MSWQDTLEADPNHWMVNFVLTAHNDLTNFYKESEGDPIPNIEVFKVLKHKDGLWKLYFTLADEEKILQFCDDNDIDWPEIIIVKNKAFPERRVTGIYFNGNNSTLYCLPRIKIQN